MSAREIVRIRLKKGKVEDKTQTDFAEVSCPANMIDLRTVSVGNPGWQQEIILTVFGGGSLHRSIASPDAQNR